MITSTRKILKKLINNVDTYNVQCFCYKPGMNILPEIPSVNIPSIEYNIQFKIGEQYYSLYISDLVIKWDIAQIGSQLRTQMDKQFQYEILDLCVKLNNRCEDYTSTKFRQFADEPDKDVDDDLE